MKKKQTWIKGEIQTVRNIRKIEGNLITVSVPLSDSYDSNYTGSQGVQVVKITTSGEISQVGIENFRIVAPTQELAINVPHDRGITLREASDSWVRNLEIYNTVNSVGVDANRVTVCKVNIYHDKPTVGAAKPADFSAGASQILFDRCRSKGDGLFYFATGAEVSGPIVLLHCIFSGDGSIQPHQRWSTGLLVDGCEVPDGGIDFMNRGEMGSGHGWTIAWAVAWNCKAKSFINQNPPGAVNWMIGCQGERIHKPMPFNKQPLIPEGNYDAHGKPVVPVSLYLAQLSGRLKMNH